jgi:hypothetical protein
MFTQLRKVEDGRRIKILTRCNREQVYRYTGGRIEKAEAILRRIRGKIYAFESAQDDFAPWCWKKAERKVRRWLDRHIPKKAVERRDVLDVYYL